MFLTTCRSYRRIALEVKYQCGSAVLLPVHGSLTFPCRNGLYSKRRNALHYPRGVKWGSTRCGFVKINAVINYKRFVEQQDLPWTDALLVPTRVLSRSTILRRQGKSIVLGGQVSRGGSELSKRHQERCKFCRSPLPARSGGIETGEWTRGLRRVSKSGGPCAQS